MRGAVRTVDWSCWLNRIGTDEADSPNGIMGGIALLVRLVEKLTPMLKTEFPPPPSPSLREVRTAMGL